VQPAAAEPPARSGLLVPIPEAEAAIGGLRLAHDPTAGLGIPAHVTVLFPFVPAEAVDAALHADLAVLFASVGAFEYAFREVDRFADSTVFLVPEPAEAFSDLTRRVVERWPDHPPYEGAFEVVVPHLTVGDQLADGVADALQPAVARALERNGPISGRCANVILMTERPDGRWTLAGRYPLAA
jgi:2'-5' RNA ligase superfamily